jgi:hypothetical protein
MDPMAFRSAPAVPTVPTGPTVPTVPAAPAAGALAGAADVAASETEAPPTAGPSPLLLALLLAGLALVAALIVLVFALRHR